MNNAWRIFGIVAAFIFVFAFGVIIGVSGMVLFSRNHFQEMRLQREKEQAERQDERKKETAQAQQLSQQINSLRLQLNQEQMRGQNGQRRGPMAPEQFGPHLMQMFANRLELTSDQQQQVHVLVFQTAEDLRRLGRNTAHESQIDIEHLEDQISALLTPAQRNRFNDMIQQSREAFQRWNDQQQQWRTQQRLQQQGWRQSHPGQGQGKGQPAPANPAPAAAPASPSAAPPAANPPAAAPASPSPAGQS